jgi:hypothetical protein
MCTKPGCQCAGQEVDHKVWGRYKRRGVAEQRWILVAAGLERLLPVSFSHKAGCGCGCSPGLISSSSWGRDYNISALRGEPTSTDTSAVEAIVQSTPDLDSETIRRWAAVDYIYGGCPALAKHPNCPVDVLVRLLDSPHLEVHQAAAANPKLPQATLAMWQLVHAAPTAASA